MVAWVRGRHAGAKRQCGGALIVFTLLLANSLGVGALAASGAPSPATARACSAVYGLDAVVIYDYAGSHGPTPAPTCVMPMESPAQAGPSTRSAVTLALDADGLTATFRLAQPAPPRLRKDFYYVDGLAIHVQAGNVRRPIFTATVAADGTCRTLSHVARYSRQDDQCRSRIAIAWRADCTHADRPCRTWGGTLTIPYAALDTVLDSTGPGVSRFAVTITRRSPQAEELIACSAPASREPPDKVCTDPEQVPFLTIRRRFDSVWSQAFVSAGVDVGKSVDVPAHRSPVNAWVPLSTRDVASASFSDDAGTLLSIRDTAAAGILDTGQAARFGCHVCASFATANTAAFVPAFTSAGVLGVDLSLIGVDTPPFTFAAANYPLDSGYEYVHSDNALVGIAAFDGTTATAGSAHDAVVQYSTGFYWKNNALQLDAYDALANRSLAALAPAGQYPAIAPFGLRSANTQLSIAYTGRGVANPQPVQGAPDGPAPFADATPRPNLVDPLATKPIDSYGALVRYGTQYGAGGQTFDAAISNLRDPAVFDVYDAYGSDRPRPRLAIGYRNVGASYAPLDAQYDLHTGEHGPYAVIDVTTRVCSVRRAGAGTDDEEQAEGATRAPEPCHLRTKLADVKITGYRFGDAVEARDTSLGVALTYPFWDTLSVAASYTNASLTVSQAARSNGIVVSDAAGGLPYLPNGQYSVGLTYTANTADAKFFELSAGYTRAQSQGCNTSLFVSGAPCYAYRSPSATGSLYWVPFRSFSDVFLDASIANATSAPFQTGRNAILAASALDLYRTTASHIVRGVAVGTHLFPTLGGGCSTLLLTTSNRGGTIDTFEQNPPAPGSTNTASLEFVPGGTAPTLLVAYSDTHNLDPATPGGKLFLVRLQYGLLPRTYTSSIVATCR